MPAPADVGRFGRVVVGIIILRHVDGDSLVDIAVVFAFESQWILFGVSGVEEMPPIV